MCFSYFELSNSWVNFNFFNASNYVHLCLYVFSAVHKIIVFTIIFTDVQFFITETPKRKVNLSMIVSVFTVLRVS